MDKDAFERRALGCAKRLHGIAYAMLGSEADCEDAVSEALLKAWLRLDGLREERYFETWLTRILINVCKQTLRSRAAHRAVALPRELPEPPAKDPVLADALRSLPVQYRLPLVLHHIQGYSTAEVSTLLRLPQSTVKWRLYTARNMLKAALSEGDDVQ